MTKTSHKKNRPFDFKLIDLVEPHPILYQRQNGLSTFDAMKIKNGVWKDIASEMGHTIQFCMMRWNNLRGQFQKELRRCRELCPKSGVIKGSSWPYLERLKFLEHTVQYNKSTKHTKPLMKRLNFGKDNEALVFKEEEENLQVEREIQEEMDDHMQVINKIEEDDSTEIGWEECEEYFDDDDPAINDETSPPQLQVFKQENDSSLESQHIPDHHQQQNVVLDGSDFSIITEIIVNSGDISQDVTLTPSEEAHIEEFALIEANHEPQMSQSPSISQSSSLSQSSISLISNPPLEQEQQQQPRQNEPTVSQPQIQQQQQDPQQHQQQQLSQQNHQPLLAGNSSNFQKMRYLLDGFDDNNRQRIERRIMAYLCRVQLSELFSQDVNSLNI